MDQVFEFFKLNPAGVERAALLATEFDSFYARIRELIGTPASGSTRELAIVRTNLEAACMYSKKALAMNPANQA